MHEDLGEMRKLRHIWAKSWMWDAKEELALNEKFEKFVGRAVL